MKKSGDEGLKKEQLSLTLLLAALFLGNLCVRSERVESSFWSL